MLQLAPLVLLSCVHLAAAYVPASASPNSLGFGNATFKGTWKNTQSTGSAGVFGGQLVTLSPGDGSGVVASNTSTSYGIVTYFNETSALAMNRSLVPFFGWINCDANTTVLPDLATNSSMNSTRNATSVDAFDLAASLGAQGVILYSAFKESCVLSETYLLSNSSKPLPIYTTPTLDFTNVILGQMGNVNATNVHFNSTLLNAAYAAANLTTFTPATVTAALANYLVGEIAYYNASAATNQSTSPTYATVGHAPSSTTAAGSVGAATGSPSGGERSFGVGGVSIVLGLVGGMFVLWA